MTVKSFVWFAVFFLLLIPDLRAQKVKYKDIFALLSTKQYEQAEPFLKKYLQTNDDNPNAWLYMGMIFQEKALGNDVLKETELALAHMDSAISCYDKTLKMIDEREVRRNREYYQAYNRRDLRTGEFGVKLSDIQFDLEKKIEGLLERIGKVKMVKHFFSLSDSLYRKSNKLYRELQNTYDTERQLLLRADEQTIQQLTLLSERFDSCITAFENYKSSSSNLGKTGYNQELILVTIKDFRQDGTSLADFYQDDLKLWDYRKFAKETSSTIRSEIFPVREKLVRLDREIETLREKLSREGESVRQVVDGLRKQFPYGQLQNFDPEPLPTQIFNLKVYDLSYQSVLLENLPFQDSADVHVQLKLVDKELELLKVLDSLLTRLPDEYIDLKATDYAHFIQNTGGDAAIKQYVNHIRDFTSREKVVKDSVRVKRLEALNWIVDGTDSIPLNDQYPDRKYRPLLTLEEQYTIGLHYGDTVKMTGYLYTISPSRKPGLKVSFPAEQEAFRPSGFRQVKALSFSDAGQLFFVLIYSENQQDGKYPATLAKIYRTDGLAWTNNLQLSFKPSELFFKNETGEVVIRDGSDERVIDKNGKTIR